jgi:hypothetical protein
MGMSFATVGPFCGNSFSIGICVHLQNLRFVSSGIRNIKPPAAGEREQDKVRHALSVGE